MEFEAPVDAWYVWMGVGVVSVAIAGVALGMPTTPPPDANEAANTIDRVAGSSYGGTATYDHNAREYRITTKQIEFKNAGGRSASAIAFGNVTPVWPDRDLQEVLGGESPEENFANASEFQEAVREAQATIDKTDPNWRPADETLRVRAVAWGDVYVTLVGA